MLDSNQIEHELELRGFTLKVDNTHTRGFSRPDSDQILYVKTSKKLKNDPLTPLFKQPLVLRWSFKSHSNYPKLLDLVPEINPNYVNHNMRGFSGPGKSDKANGIAIGISSSRMIDEVLALIGLSPDLYKSPDEDIANAKLELDKLSPTTKEATIDARRGQGKFRSDLIEYWQSCAVTGCNEFKLLRASHINPWRNSNNIDRLNHFNGLLLTANLDLAFDQGLISFDINGHILIKGHLFSNDNLAALNIHSSMKLRQLDKNHQSYLAEHRRLHQF